MMTQNWSLEKAAVSWGRAKVVKGLESLSCKENLRELGLLSLEMARGDHIPVLHCLKGSSAFAKSCREKTKHSGYRLHWARFHLDIEKNSAERALSHWNSLPRDAVQTLWLSTVLNSLIQALWSTKSWTRWSLEVFYPLSPSVILQILTFFCASSDRECLTDCSLLCSSGGWSWCCWWKRLVTEKKLMWNLGSHSAAAAASLFWGFSPNVIQAKKANVRKLPTKITTLVR